MASTLESLLQDSTAAARAGRTEDSWQLASRFATEFWLTTPHDAPDELRGEYLALRSAAADNLGLIDEAIESLLALQDWARSNDDHEVALIAAAHLAYQSLNQDDDSLHTLSSPTELLARLAEDFRNFRPDPDSPTLGEDSSLDWRSLEPRMAAKLTQAATTAYTVATNLSLSDATTPELINAFSGYIRRFGRAEPKEADRILWFAQEAWMKGDSTKARELANSVLELPQPGRVSQFEAHDMLGHFCLLQATGQAEVPDQPGADPEQELASHWQACALLALSMQAPVVALKRTELSGHLLMDVGQSWQANEMIRDTLEAMEGAPMGAPAMLNLRLAGARAALEVGDVDRAAQLASGVAEWSAFTADDQRTEAAQTILTMARQRGGES
ncbi:hypothetical protein D3M95_05425 [Corynebacterium falsenii]|uniref:Uncharacterized protein n=1 Tax=Corynebacterium falsenii TaxID=108486 RepID=A0A418Q7L5_9CORY|nr:hypothetical protein [Corynebacterium falsenii]RIX35300.1 hypothetical protein D3M95_05425 [Corynebacterium falsenii]